MNKVNYSINFSQAERAKLQWLADKSGRTAGEVIRRLLALTDDIPELRRALGIWDEQSEKAKTI